MSIYIPRHDEKKMPITMGSPLRTPSRYWGNWGIRYDYPEEKENLILLGRAEYVKEWGSGDTRQHDIVAEASKRAFKGNDNNEILRRAVGIVVAKHLEMQANTGKREFYVLDVGAGDGKSAEAILDALPKDFPGEIHMYLLDPAKTPLEIAAEKMKRRGVKCTCLNGTQDKLPILLGENNRMSAIIQVAAIHHDPSIPWDVFYESLESNGIFASGDWHPQLWQEPSYVLTMLESMEWDLKDEGIEHFKQVYKVEKASLPEDPADRNACKDIIDFWKAYKKGLEDAGIEHGNNSIWPLEAHQDFRDYLSDMNRAGLKTERCGYLRELLQESGDIENPHQFYPNSTIIMGIFGCKTE
jgi:hypothetical protein